MLRSAHLLKEVAVDAARLRSHRRDVRGLVQLDGFTRRRCALELVARHVFRCVTVEHPPLITTSQSVNTITYSFLNEFNLIYTRHNYLIKTRFNAELNISRVSAAHNSVLH